MAHWTQLITSTRAIFTHLGYLGLSWATSYPQGIEVDSVEGKVEYKITLSRAIVDT